MPTDPTSSKLECRKLMPDWIDDTRESSTIASRLISDGTCRTLGRLNGFVVEIIRGVHQNPSLQP
jgi:hypothetical protein